MILKRKDLTTVFAETQKSRWCRESVQSLKPINSAQNKWRWEIKSPCNVNFFRNYSVLWEKKGWIFAIFFHQRAIRLLLGSSARVWIMWSWNFRKLVLRIVRILYLWANLPRWISVKGWKERIWGVLQTLHPSQVKAPKWNPAAFSPHTLHRKFICKLKRINSKKMPRSRAKKVVKNLLVRKSIASS